MVGLKAFSEEERRRRRPITHWSAFTSRSIAGLLGSDTFGISPLRIVKHDWGCDPKGVRGGGGTGVATLAAHDGTKINLVYETGRGWMAPIHTLLFWKTKYPARESLPG